MKLLVLLSVMALIPGCNHQEPTPAAHTIQPYQRFIPVHLEAGKQAIPFEASAGLPSSGALALDTKTGQLCWTYPHVDNKGDTSSSPTLPDCSYIYRQFPD